MLDPCFWCHRKRICRKSHNLEIVEYRVALHLRAVAMLRSKLLYLEKGELDGTVWDGELAELLSLKARDLSIEQHWLKGKYLECRKKGMDEREAWQEAKAHLEKLNKRRSWDSPTFTTQELKHIQAYEPKNPCLVEDIWEHKNKRS